MKKYIFIMFMMGFAIISLGQNKLEGTVKDAISGMPLPNASLYFADLMRGTVSDSIGNYSFSAMPGGTFLMEVKYLGYRSWVGKVVIDQKSKQDINMQPAAAEIREVIITGTSGSVERRLNPVPTMVLNTDDLSLGNTSNLIDAINRRPGISQITTGSGISKPVIRGLGYNRVIVLRDGIRQEDQQWGDEHGIEIDEYSVQRVEIIKGPGSIMYGSDAMAGVVNFLNNKPVNEGTMALNIASEFQTNNKLAGISVFQAGNIKGVNWNFRLSGKRAGNYQNKEDGKVFNSGFNELNSNGSLGLNRKWGYSQLNYSIYNQSVGLIEGERDDAGHFIKPQIVNDTLVEEVVATESDLDSYQLFIPKQKLKHLGFISSSSLLLGKSRLAFKAGFQQNQRSELAEPLFPDQASLYLKLNTLTYDLKYFFPDMKGWETSFGFGGMMQSNQNGGMEYLIPEYELNDIGFFGFTRKQSGKFLVSGGIRIDWRSLHSMELNLEDEGLKFTDFKRNFSSFSGSAGASYSIDDQWVVKINLSRGFRAPNIAELGSNGRHEGTYRYELGNKDLLPEHSLQLDAGFTYNSMHVSLETDLFLNRIDQYIFLRKLNASNGGDSIIDQHDPAPAFAFVQGDATLFGGEITLDIHPHPLDWIHFENSVGFVRGFQPGNPDSTYNLPMIPPLRFRSQLKLELPSLPLRIDHAYILIGSDYSLSQEKVYEAYGTETITPAWFTMYAGMGLNLLTKSKTTLLSIQVTANNIFNVAYQDHLSRLKYAPENPMNGKTGIYNMGRNIGFKLVFPMTWKVRS
ncbi:MAG: TonB-dependent receptor [Bacteroidales bacterium]|nr:TonB-dependent receptor [Bacteroidales bacterium]